MMSFLLDVILQMALGAGRSWRRAFGVLDDALVSPAAARLRLLTIGSLVASSCLLVAAAAAWSINRGGMFHSICGWSGVAAIEAFLLFGNRCYRVMQPND
jgi:hypothetical protein